MGKSFQSLRRSWTRHFITQVSALLVLSLTYAASLFILQSADHIRAVFYSWGKVNEAVIYLKTGTQESKINEISEIVKKDKLVQTTHFVPATEASKKFASKYAKFLPQDAGDDKIAPFFPPTLKVVLSEPLRTQAQTEHMNQLAATLSSRFVEVEEVSFGRSWMTKYLGLIALFDKLSWVLGLIIFAASIFVTNSVLQTALFSRQDEIEILELCGATSLWVYGPHILNSCLLGTIALALAIIANIAAFNFLGIQFANYFQPLDADSIITTSWGTVLLCFIGLNGAFITSSFFTIKSMKTRVAQL